MGPEQAQFIESGVQFEKIQPKAHFGEVKSNLRPTLPFPVLQLKVYDNCQHFRGTTKVLNIRL
jgi:hypothetical protein